ncbi:unnamed protein product, partial [Chrysoparadoxa australica]
VGQELQRQRGDKGVEEGYQPSVLRRVPESDASSTQVPKQDAEKMEQRAKAHKKVTTK